VKLNFNQMPEDKINYIATLQKDNHNVLMLGDGLNDAGALKQANIGIAITEKSSNFTPGSDAILQSDFLQKFPDFLLLSKRAIRTVIISYIISLLYNSIGIFFAVTGKLSPLIAAILMPLSSISVVLFTIGKVKLQAKMLKM